jgi:hypothetical protein
MSVCEIKQVWFNNVYPSMLQDDLICHALIVSSIFPICSS